MKRLALALALVAAPATAQDTYSSLFGPVTQAQMDVLAAAMPTPSVSIPPSVSDTGSVGTATTSYALANHTHASKARKGRATTATDGTLTVTLAPAFNGVPVCAVVAEATAGETNIVNAQIDGQPTTSQLKVRVNRSAAQFVGLLSLTINVVQPSVPTVVDYICIEP